MIPCLPGGKQRGEGNQRGEEETEREVKVEEGLQTQRNLKRNGDYFWILFQIYPYLKYQMNSVDGIQLNIQVPTVAPADFCQPFRVTVTAPASHGISLSA